MDDHVEPDAQVNQRRLSSLIPLKMVMVIFGFVIIATIVGEFLAITLSANDDQIEIVFFPLAEETFKLFLFIRYTRNFVSGIIIFGLIEIFIVKLPSVFIFPLIEGFTTWIVFALPPLIFHVSTAFAYSEANKRKAAYSIFLLCLFMHIVFNSLTLLTVNITTWVALTLFASLIVLLVGRVITLRSTGHPRPHS